MAVISRHISVAASFELCMENYLVSGQPLSSKCLLPSHSGPVWLTISLSGSGRESGVPLCGICCSQASWGAQSLQHYGMRSQKSPKLHSLAQEIGPKVVVDRTFTGPFVCPSSAGQLGKLAQNSSYFKPYFTSHVDDMLKLTALQQCVYSHLCSAKLYLQTNVHKEHKLGLI